MKKLLKLLSLFILLSSALNLKSSEKVEIQIGMHIHPWIGYDCTELFFTVPTTREKVLIKTRSKTNKAILDEIALRASLPVDGICIMFGKKIINLKNDRLFSTSELKRQIFGIK